MSQAESFFGFSRNTHYLSGRSMKLYVKRCKLDVKKLFFSQRVVAQWNGLAEHVVTAPTTNALKNRLDKHWTDGELTLSCALLRCFS